MKIKFAIIGVGYIGKRHAEMITQHPEAELTALCDIRLASELNIENYNVPFYNSPEALFSSGTEIDVVCIATPNGLHTFHALLSLEAGKHLVIEKPIALSKKESEQILFKALQLNKQVFCVMQNRYSPPSVWLNEIVKSGKLGNIFMVQVNCYWNRDDRYYKKGGWKGTSTLDGGTLFTQFSHFIDTMYWLFGDITNIKATFKDFAHSHSTDFEDSGLVNFDFVNGGMGCINYSTAIWDKNLESSITIIAENGTVKVGGQYMNNVEYCHIKNYTMPVLAEGNLANDYGTYKGSAANHNFVFENVMNVIGGRTTITTNAMEGMKVVEIIERIYQLK